MKSLRSSIVRRPNPPRAANAGDLHEQHGEWQIQNVRQAISQDWIRLAAKGLTSEQRKAVREHLEMNVAALRDLTERKKPSKGRTLAAHEQVD